MNNLITLVIGGCRSGKSSYALETANQIKGNKKIFMATSVPTDKEMEERVIKHVQERGQNWQTAEVPVDISEKIIEFSSSSDVILIDCLTLWTSNLMFNNYDEDRFFKAVQKLQTALEKALCPVLLVSNEVGSGIVPENALARKFRDLAGFVNQKIAQTADNVTWMVAGIPVQIKPK